MPFSVETVDTFGIPVLKKKYTSLLQERPIKETIFGKCPQPSTRHLVDTLVSTE